MANPTRTKDTSIPVGSTVKVIDSGKGYSSYAAMASFMKLTKWPLQPNKRYPIDGKTYTVVAKAIHESEFYGEVLGLQDEDGNQVMIGIGGVILVTTPKVSVSAQVATLEAQLEVVTQERDQLKALVESIQRMSTLD